MTASPMILAPVDGGWSICLANGVELQRFRGAFAWWRAQRRLVQLTRMLTSDAQAIQ